MRQIKGGALLTALFIMTLVAIVATAMSMRLQLDIYRTRLIIAHDQLYLASQAVTFWALGELNNKSNQFIQTNKKGMVAQYPENAATIYNKIKLSGGLYDLQARFNLNNLAERKSLSLFLNLMSHAVPQSTSKERTNLVLALQEWFAPYDLSQGKDLYTSYYVNQNPPYYSSHQLMKSTSELRLVKDVDASVYLMLEPFITALPESTPININTASKPVLMSLGHGLTEAQTNELLVARGENGIKTFNDIRELLKKLDLPNEQITLDSKYFLNVAYASSEEFNLVVYTMLKRSRDAKGKLSVGVIGESINGF